MNPPFREALLVDTLRFDDFTAQLGLARSPLFEEWALLTGGAGMTSNGSTRPILVKPPGTGAVVGSDDDDDNAGSEDDGDDKDDD